jgi:hypothetical protein
MGGSAPDHTSTTTELPAWAQPYAESLMQRSGALSDQAMPVYQAQRSADMNGYQTAGMNMVQQRALGGSSDIMAGSKQVRDTNNGGYLGYSAGQNQYQGQQPGTTNGYMGQQPGTTNAYMGNQSAAQNGYMGDNNPYLQNMVDRSARDITMQYNGATQNNDASFARSGAFGGSAWQNAQMGAQRQLGQSLADSSNALRSHAYDQSAGLQEASLNRDQNYFNTNAGLAQNQLGMNQSAWNANAGMAQNQLGMNQANWNANAGMAENNLNRNQQAYMGERSNMMQASSLAPTYGNQAYTDAAQLQNAGATQYGFDNQNVQNQMGYWNDAAQSPYKQLDVLANGIRGAVGGGGQVTQSGPGVNPYAQAAGGAAAAYGLLSK